MYMNDYDYVPVRRMVYSHLKHFISLHFHMLNFICTLVIYCLCRFHPSESSHTLHSTFTIAVSTCFLFTLNQAGMEALKNMHLCQKWEDTRQNSMCLSTMLGATHTIFIILPSSIYFLFPYCSSYPFHPYYHQTPGRILLKECIILSRHKHSGSIPFITVIFLNHQHTYMYIYLCEYKHEKCAAIYIF